MNLKFMDRSLSEKHRELGLSLEQCGDYIYLLQKGIPVCLPFGREVSALDVKQAADQALGELTNGISFGCVE